MNIKTLMIILIFNLCILSIGHLYNFLINLHLKFLFYVKCGKIFLFSTNYYLINPIGSMFNCTIDLKITHLILNLKIICFINSEIIKFYSFLNIFSIPKPNFHLISFYLNLLMMQNLVSL